MNYATAIAWTDDNEREIARGHKCPECGSGDTESNESTEYRCCECDHRWGVDCGERYGF